MIRHTYGGACAVIRVRSAFEKLEREQPERAAAIKAHYAAHREAMENGN